MSAFLLVRRQNTSISAGVSSSSKRISIQRYFTRGLQAVVLKFFEQLRDLRKCHVSARDALIAAAYWLVADDLFLHNCGTDPRLLSGEQRTSHFKLVTSVDGPGTDIGSDQFTPFLSRCRVAKC